jgi:hypothetical protein
MGKSIVGTIIGTAIAFGLIVLAQYLGNFIAPEVYDPATEEVLIPLGATVALFLGWFIGSFAGSWLAMRVSGSGFPGWIVAGAVVGAAVYRAVTIGEASWVVAAGFILPLAAAWLAGRAARLAE